MKNLYEIRFRHYSPKDSEEGILTYLVADSDEYVYEWLKGNPMLNNEEWFVSVGWEDEEKYVIYEWSEEIQDEVAAGTYRDFIIAAKGDMYDDETEVNDRFYGVTLYGWALVKEDISQTYVSVLKDSGISLHENYGG